MMKDQSSKEMGRRRALEEEGAGRQRLGAQLYSTRWTPVRFGEIK